MSRGNRQWIETSFALLGWVRIRPVECLERPRARRGRCSAHIPIASAMLLATHRRSFGASFRTPSGRLSFALRGRHPTTFNHL